MSADQFVGAWRLLSLEARTSTGDISYPYGPDAAGYLLYSSEGYMSVAIMQARRAQFASSPMTSGRCGVCIGPPPSDMP